MVQNNMIQVNCSTCNKKILIYPYRVKRTLNHFCNQKCYAKWNNRGIINGHGFFYQQHHTKESNEKNSKWHTDNPNLYWLGKKRSLGTRKKISATLQSIPIENWIYFTRTLEQKIKGLDQYKKWRSEIFKRDNYTCSICGTNKVTIHADHFPVNFSTILRENKIKNTKDAIKCTALWRVENGRTLCVDCHWREHSINGKIWNADYVAVIGENK